MSQARIRGRTADEWKTEGPKTRTALDTSLESFRSASGVDIPKPKRGRSKSPGGGDLTPGFPKDKQSIERWRGLPAELQKVIVGGSFDHPNHLIPRIDAGSKSLDEPGVFEAELDYCRQLLDNVRICLKPCYLRQNIELRAAYEAALEGEKRYIYYLTPTLAPTTSVENFVAFSQELFYKLGPPDAFSIDLLDDNKHFKALKKIYECDYESNEDGVRKTKKIATDTLYVQSGQKEEFDQGWPEEKGNGYLVMQSDNDDDVNPKSSRETCSDDHICNKIIYGYDDTGKLLQSVEVAHMEKFDGKYTFVGAPNVCFPESTRLFTQMSRCLEDLPKVKHVRLLFFVGDGRLKN